MLLQQTDLVVCCQHTCRSVTSVACIVSFQVLFFNWPLYSRHTNCQAGSTPVPTAALPAPVAATSRGAARPSSPAAQTAASLTPATATSRSALVLAVVYVFFAAAVLAGGTSRGHVPRARRRLCCRTSPSPRPSPQVAPTSALALQASKFYSGEAAEKHIK